MKNPPLPWVMTLIAGSLFATRVQQAAAAAPPGPAAVPGKEYTDNPDISSSGSATPGQILLWPGNGTVSDGPVVSALFGSASAQVDALAARNDAYFREVAFLNSADLLVSVKGDSALNSVWYESPDGSRGVWASKAQINARGVTDLDALEVWGREGQSDSRVVSLHGDTGGIPLRTIGGVPIMVLPELADAIGLSIGATTVNGVFLGANVVAQIRQNVQLDALMFNHRGVFSDTFFTDPLTGPPPLSWGSSDDILFSIEPITVTVGGIATTLFDGGEVWTYRLGGVYSSAPAAFLNHGGHLWDTAFDVRSAFGVQSEDIDALEAVGPVPETGTTIAATVFGLVAGSEILRRRRAVRG